MARFSGFLIHSNITRFVASFRDIILRHSYSQFVHTVHDNLYSQFHAQHRTTSIRTGNLIVGNFAVFPFEFFISKEPFEIDKRKMLLT